MIRQFFAIVMGVASTAAFAQLNSSVSVEGEYEPLVIETERLNTFPLGYRFELPARSLDYEYQGVVADFRPDLLTMGVTGRQTLWPWKARRGFADARLGSYLNGRLHAGYYILADKTNTLLAELKFRDDAYADGYSLPSTERNRLYDGSLAVRYSGFFASSHSLYASAEGGYKAYDQGASEGSLDVDVRYAYTFSERNSIGMDVQGDFLFPHRVYGNYGVVSLKPGYRFASDRVSVGIAADLSFAYNALGSFSDKKFGTFHVAPDFTLQYNSKAGVGLFLTATGGVTPASTVNRFFGENYFLPWLWTPQPVYTPLDARAGLQVGPFAGFSATATFRYAIARNMPLHAFDPDITDFYASSANLHGFSLGLGLHYALGTILKLDFEGTYTPQKGENGVFNGFDRPRWTLEASAAVRPIRKLCLEVGYDYRGVRNFYEYGSGGLMAQRIGDIANLNAKITYSVLDNLDIYCAGNNLLNRHEALLPGLSSEGFAISGGIYVEF